MDLCAPTKNDNSNQGQRSRSTYVDLWPLANKVLDHPIRWHLRLMCQKINVHLTFDGIIGAFLIFPFFWHTFSLTWAGLFDAQTFFRLLNIKIAYTYEKKPRQEHKNLFLFEVSGVCEIDARLIFFVGVPFCYF